MASKTFLRFGAEVCLDVTEDSSLREQLVLRFESKLLKLDSKISMIKRGTNGKFIFLSEDDSHDFLSFMFANSHDLGDRSDYYIICGEIDESYTIELANKYKLYSENSIMEFTRILSAKILTRDNDSQSIVEYSH